MTDETKVEAVLIAMLAASSSPVLAGLPVHHADDNARTDDGEETVTEYIAVTATKGDKLLDGPECTAYEAAIEYRSTTTAADIDEKMKGIEAAVESPSPDQITAGQAKAVAIGIKFFKIEPAAKSDRSAEGLRRTRSRTWTVIAA